MGESHLIGRRSDKRGVFPEIALDSDDAVSHRHALLNRTPGGGLVLRDVGSSNGTRLNGVDVAPLTDMPLKSGGRDYGRPLDAADDSASVMSTAVAPRHAVAASHNWTTPEILKGGILAIWVASAMLVAAAIAGARSHRHAMQVVGRDSAPSIMAAQEIRTSLAAMDAESTSADLKIYEEQRGRAVSAIVTAARNITYGEAEEKPIRTMTQQMSAYAESVQGARDRRDISIWRNAWAKMGR